jgi:O-antigen/teichoic acid export membrane protein
MFPQLASMKSEDMRRAFTPIVARNVLLLSTLGGLGLFIGAPWLMSFLYGGEFAGAATALRFLLPGIVILAASRVLANDIAARGRPLVNSYLGIAMLVVNLTFNLILIPRMGINGAALASTISYSTNGLLRLIIYCRLSGNTPLDVILLQKSDLEGYRRLINRGKRRISTHLRG